jgi:cytochrome c-type biogenesis protein CcmE
MTQSQRKYTTFGAAVAVVVLLMSYLAWTGVQESKSYYVTIKELHAMDASVYTKHLRVGGNVVPGSIRKVGSNADFLLVEVDPNTKERQEMRVSYKGTEPPPDTFKDDAQALVVGEFGKDGTFHAHEIQAKCASKYAPQQQTGAGMPAADSRKN